MYLCINPTFIWCIHISVVSVFHFVRYYRTKSINQYMSAELTVSSSSVCLRVSLISVNWNWRTLWAWRSRSNSWNRTHNQNSSAPAVFDSTRCVLCVTSDLAGDVTVSPWLPQQLLHVAQLLPQSFHLIHQSRLLVVQLSVRNHRLTVLLLHLSQRVLNTHTHTVIIIIIINNKLTSLSWWSCEKLYSFSVK